MNRRITIVDRRVNVPLGNNLPDPFIDSYVEEMYTCHDIIEMVNGVATRNVSITIDKEFLTKIVRSHIHMIKELEKVLK